MFNKSYLMGASALCLLAGMASADQVILDDLIVDGSICVGMDCVNGESFGFDTIRLKENNLRIKFQDTSASASFPSNDWQLTANDSGNGGANKFSIDDIDGGRTPFTIEATAPSNSLYVDDGGRIGFGTGAPVVEAHIVDGDTPTLRLEQNGSSGFGTQTWDLAGNETNFFIRDATNGSQLPFRIAPGADTNSISVAADNDIGMGLQTPEVGASLHLRRSNGTSRLLVEEISSTVEARELLILRNNGQVAITMEDTSVTPGDDTGRLWKIQNVAGEMRMTTSPGGPGERELTLNTDGDLSIEGSFISAATTLTVPDYVFADDYALRPLADVRSFIDENSHLPEVPSAADIAASGLDHTAMQLTLLKKVEELTLYTLAQEETIATQQAQYIAQQAQIDALLEAVN